jgi:hypothetical protein
MNPYQKLQQRKRKWSPVQTTAGKLNEGAEEAIFRALAMRHMELPVGEFIEASLSEIPVLSQDLLRSNIKDEENHDLALGYIANALGTDPKAEEEALRIRAAWERILITRSLKHLLPSVHFSSFYSRSFDLMVTLVSAPSPLTSVEMSKSTWLQTLLSAGNLDSPHLQVSTSSARQRSIGL